MAVNLNLERALSPDPAMWARIGAYAVAARKKATERGRDKDDRPFKAYTKEYAKRKAASHRSKKGNRPAALQGISLETKTNPPNFRLRGITMRNLKVLRRTSRSVVIGWRGEAAQIVAAHERRGKYKVAGATNKEVAGVLDIVGRELEKNLSRFVRDITIDVKL